MARASCGAPLGHREAQRMMSGEKSLRVFVWITAENGPWFEARAHSETGAELGSVWELGRRDALARMVMALTSSGFERVEVVEDLTSPAAADLLRAVYAARGHSGIHSGAS
jgi:hypothetical protein